MTQLFGGDNNDFIFGNEGNDRLDGGTGPDFGDGGPDFDSCVNVENETNCEA